MAWRVELFKGWGARTDHVFDARARLFIAIMKGDLDSESYW